VIPPAPLRAAATEPGIGSDTAAVACRKDAVAHRFRFELASHPGSAAQARRITRAWLAARAVPDDSCDSAALVVSELVTNAIVHTSSRQIVCELTEGAEKVRIAVCDEGCTPDESPRPSAVRDEEEHGRGLLLVATVCSAWGAHESGPGLQVWAELPCGAEVRRKGIGADGSVRGTGATWVS
jgi:anti-sigma regulatory factor (Ser/Thr protein kinase)